MPAEDRAFAAADVVVALHGELDVARSAEIVATVSEAVAAADGRVAVDMSDVPFVDSTALGAFIAVYGRARDAGVTLRLVNANRRVTRLLDVTRLHDTLL